MVAPNDLHKQEWLNSQVSLSLIEANVQSVPAGRHWENMFVSPKLDQKPYRTNTGRLSQTILRTYEQFDLSNGWSVFGLDPITGKETVECLTKLDTPRKGKDGKDIKYESQKLVDPRPWLAKMPYEIGLRIAAANGERESYEKRIIEIAGKIPDFDDPFWEQVDDGFYQWVKGNKNIRIAITEGPKKAGCLDSQGRLAISVNGIWLTQDQSRVDKLNKTYKIHPLIEWLCDGREVTIYFDQDEKLKTQINVYKAIARVGRQLQALGNTVNVATWDRRKGKGIDDFIANGNFIQSVSITPLDKYLDKAPIERLKKLDKYEVSQVVTTRYLGETITTMPDSKNIALKAPKGCGKTELIAQWVKVWTKRDYRVLVLGHRRQLLIDLCNRLGVLYIDEMVQDKYTRKEGQLFGYGMCFDSLRKASRIPFNKDEWLGDDTPYIVIVDECEQSIEHLLSAQTDIRKNRPEIFLNYQDLLVNSSHNIFADADLTDVTLDYLSEITEDDKPYIIESLYQGENNYKCHTYGESTPLHLVKDMLESLDDGKHFIFTQAQQKKSVYSTTNLEILIKELFPNKAILRIDAESVVDPEHPAYGCIATGINNIIEGYNIIICSPCVETGLSIEDKSVTHVWGIFQGLGNANIARQVMSRVRVNCDRSLWCGQKGLTCVGNGSYSHSQLKDSQDRKFRINQKMLHDVGFDDEIQETTSTIHYDTWVKMSLRTNYDYHHYRESVYDGLIDEGQILSPMPKEDYKSLEGVRQLIKENRKKNYLEHRKRIANADDVTDEQYKQLKDRQERKEKDRLEYAKGTLNRKYNVPVTESLVLWDDNSLYPKLRLYYYLFMGNKHLPARDKAIAKNNLHNGKTWLPDFNKNLKMPYVYALQVLDIRKLWDYDELDKDTPIVVEIAELCRKLSRDDCKEYLGFCVGEMGNIQIIQSLVARVGCHLPKVKHKRINDKRVRVYGKPEFIYRDEDGTSSTVERILDWWLIQDEKREQQPDET